jgi:hypothetical protein
MREVLLAQLYWRYWVNISTAHFCVVFTGTTKQVLPVLGKFQHWLFCQMSKCINAFFRIPKLCHFSLFSSLSQSCRIYHFFTGHKSLETLTLCYPEWCYIAANKPCSCWSYSLGYLCFCIVLSSVCDHLWSEAASMDEGLSAFWRMNS